MTLHQLALDALACPGLPPNEWHITFEGPAGEATGGYLLARLTCEEVGASMSQRETGRVFRIRWWDPIEGTNIGRWHSTPLCASLAEAVCRVVVARGRW